jgi:hypothetical protein
MPSYCVFLLPFCIGMFNVTVPDHVSVQGNMHLLRLAALGQNNLVSCWYTAAVSR